MDAWTPEELEVYEYWQIRDAADRYGKERDLELEFEKGRYNKSIEVACNLKKAGIATDIIILTYTREIGK